MARVNSRPLYLKRGDLILNLILAPSIAADDAADFLTYPVMVTGITFERKHISSLIVPPPHARIEGRRVGLSNAGWSLGWVSAVDCQGRTIWIVDAHGDGKRFIVQGEKLTAFLEVESAIRGCRELS